MSAETATEPVKLEQGTPTLSADHSHLEQVFSQVCAQLQVSSTVKKKTWDYWLKLKLDVNQEEESCNQSWLMCLLYVAATETRLPYGTSDPQHINGQLDDVPMFTVSQLLSKANLHIVDFFQRVKAIKEHLPLSSTVTQNIKTLEKKYCITSALFYKFEKIFQQIFKADDENFEPSPLHPVNTIDTSNSIKRELCWLLFIMTKGSLIPSSSELILHFHILLCCIDYVLRMVPSFLLNSPYDTVRCDSSENYDQYCMLKQMCQQYDASFEEVKSMYVKCWEPFVLSLPHDQGIIDLNLLKQKYTDLFIKLGDIDEQHFLSHDPLLVPKQVKETSHENGHMLEVPVTPVRAAIVTVQQLVGTLQNAGDQPSPTLLNFFQHCSTNPKHSILTRLDTLQHTFTQSVVAILGASQTHTAQQRFNMASRLYYKVMEQMLKIEEERLSSSDFSTLLNNEIFHRCLLACSVEVVMTTYNTSWNSDLLSPSSCDFEFPWILKVFDLKAFDFYKVIESFVRAVPMLTRETVQHLQDVENRILESIAWEDGSPLFDLLKSCDTTPSKPGMTISPNLKMPAEGSTSVSVMKQFLSPTRTSNPHQDSPNSQAASKSKPITRKSNSLSLFYNKVYKLAYRRLQVMCTRLEVPKDLQLKIWTCLEHCITHKPGLMKNRHLDQILLCSIYAICKVVDLEKELKFKTIVNVYRDLPHATPEIYKSALISGSDYDSIIKFYNNVFMQQAKNVIIQFGTAKSSMTASFSPVPKNMNSPLTSPGYSIPGHQNFYVSPMKDSPFKTPLSPSQMTPRTKQLYSFGEGIGSSEKLKTINETLKATTQKRRVTDPSIPRSQKRLRFDQNDQDQNSASSEAEAPIIVRRTAESPVTTKIMK